MNCIGALSFFQDLFKHFHDFWSQIGVVILVTPKQEVEQKSEWFCGVNIFCSNFKVEWENCVWTKICFLASGFLFTCGNFNLIFCFLFQFFGSDFLNGFSNSFIVHSMPIFLFEPNFPFSLVVFCSHAAFWQWFSVFLKFFIWFFRNGFLNSLLVRSRSSFFV